MLRFQMLLRNLEKFIKVFVNRFKEMNLISTRTVRKNKRKKKFSKNPHRDQPQVFIGKFQLLKDVNKVYEE